MRQSQEHLPLITRHISPVRLSINNPFDSLFSNGTMKPVRHRTRVPTCKVLPRIQNLSPLPSLFNVKSDRDLFMRPRCSPVNRRTPVKFQHLEILQGQAPLVFKGETEVTFGNE